jgi:hypothetical protein
MTVRCFVAESAAGIPSFAAPHRLPAIERPVDAGHALDTESD